MNEIEKTIAAYDRSGAGLAAQYRAHSGTSHSRFRRVFSRPGKVLDIGIGSGKDLQTLLDAGFDAYGLEPSKTLIDEALRFYPALTGRIFRNRLPIDSFTLSSWTEQFEGVNCCAVFMHLPEAMQSLAFQNIRQILRPGGRCNLVISTHRSGLDVNGTDDLGRYYGTIETSGFLERATRVGFRLLEWKELSPIRFSRGEGWQSWIMEKPGLDDSGIISV